MTETEIRRQERIGYILNAVANRRFPDHVAVDFLEAMRIRGGFEDGVFPGYDYIAQRWIAT